MVEAHPAHVIPAPPDNCPNCMSRHNLPVRSWYAYADVGTGRYVVGAHHCPKCGTNWQCSWRVEKPSRIADVHLVSCDRCGAPDEWVSIYDRMADYLGIVWDCYCDVCGNHWTENVEADAG